VAEAAKKIGLQASGRDNLEDALEAVRKLDLDPPPRILITGSPVSGGRSSADERYAAGVKGKTAGTRPAVKLN